MATTHLLFDEHDRRSRRSELDWRNGTCPGRARWSLDQPALLFSTDEESASETA